MRFLVLLIGLALVASANAASVKQAFSEGKHRGQIRLYNNVLEFQNGSTDQYGTALGGHLGFETAAEHLAGFSLGFAYYGSNDLGMSHHLTAKQAPLLPSVDVDLLGEAYLKWSGHDSVVTLGRQVIVTPFANPADAFLVPVLFSGYSLVNKSIAGLTINAHHLTRVKNRQAQDFTNVGIFTSGRFGGTVQDTKGVSILGLTYKMEKTTAQGWYYLFPDIMNMAYAQVDHGFDMGTYKPYVSAHYGTQSDEGDKLLGTVDSTMVGVKVGAKAHGGDLSIGFDNVADNTFISPFAFFTDVFYANSMITGMSNVNNGTSWKLMLLYNFTEQLWGKLSYASFDFKNDTDMTGTDFDLRYKFKDDWDGFQIWFRSSYRNGDNPALAKLIEYRTQLQYTF